MNRSSNSINCFFIEMILVILFFAVSSAVILQVFVAAGNRANQSGDLSAAVVCAQNFAEQLRAIRSPDELPPVLKTAKNTGSDDGRQHFQIHYDREWNETSNAPRYMEDVSLTKTTSNGGVMIRAEITVFRVEPGGRQPIFTLSPARYLPGTA